MYFKKGIVRGKWQFFKLVDEDIERIEKELRNDNIRILKMCLKDAETIEADFKIQITRMLFDKLATQKFTRIQSALDSKIKQAEEGTVYTSQFKPITTTGKVNVDMGTKTFETDINKLKQEKIDSDSEIIMDSKSGQVV